MNKHQSDVKEFMVKAGQNVPDKVVSLDEETAKLRYNLIKEELDEFREALGLVYYDTHMGFEPQKQDLVECADAIADLLYVVYGASVSLGLDVEPIFAEVQRSNMSKFIDGYRREDGKYIKGPSYSPANLLPIIEKQLNNANPTKL